MSFDDYGKKIPSPKDFGAMLDDFFETHEIEDWNMASIKLHCGVSRKQWESMKKDEEYVKVIDYMLDHVEAKYLHDLNSRNPTGAIFALKNQFDYADRKDVKATLEGKISIEQMLAGAKMKA